MNKKLYSLLSRIFYKWAMYYDNKVDKFCIKCGGRGLVPRSGIWGQSDGWKICPRCWGLLKDSAAKFFNTEDVK